MKRHVACCVCQDYASNSCPCGAKFETAGWRLHASGLGNKTLRTCSGKHFLLLKKYKKIKFFVKLFPLSFHQSAFEVTFIKTSNPSSADKNNSFAPERLYTHDALSLILFSPITDRLFSINTRFPALSILSIFLDKCQMKSFEDIDISIKVKVFRLKTFF